MSSFKFSLVPDREWDYIKFSEQPDGTKLSADARQKLADAQIYFSFKRNMYYCKGRIDPKTVQTCLKGAEWEVRKGYAGYIAPLPKAKASTAPAETSEVAQLRKEVAKLAKLVAKLAH
jgi:hypothetical protein